MRGLEQIPWLYDAMCWTYERLGLGPWREWLVAGARGRTLDIGCGTGRNLSLYADRVRVVALEPQWETLQRARRRAAADARARAIPHAGEGAVPGSRPALLDAALRRLPSEPRHRGRGRGVGVHDRGRRPAREGRHAALLR